MDETSRPNTDSEQQVPLTRRQILKTAAGAGLILLAPMLAEHAEAAAAPAEQWTPAGKAAEFIAGTPKRVALPNGDILYVTRQDAKTLTAISAKCTHQGCEIGWKTADSQFHCPCHGAVFAVTGKNVKGPSRRSTPTLSPLPAVSARQNGTQVEVNLAGTSPADFQPNSRG